MIPSDSLPASQRDVPDTTRRYIGDYGGDSGVKAWRIPLNVKVCGIVNKTDQDLAFYPTLYRDGEYVGAGTDLHSVSPPSSRIEVVAAGATFPLAQNDLLNTLVFSSGSAAVGELWFRTGQGTANGLADAGEVEVQELVALTL